MNDISRYTETNAEEWVEEVKLTKLPGSFKNVLNKPPWNVSRSNSQAEVINRILNHSVILQSSTIPTADYVNFHHFILSNCCNNITFLLKHYFDHLSITNVNVVCGGLEPPSDDEKAIMHVFLDIDDEIIDNTYIHIDNHKSSQENLNRFFDIFPSFKTVDKYNKVAPSRTMLNFYQDAKSGIEFQYTELSCSNNLNMRKALVSSMITRPGTGFVVYDKLMRHFIKKELNVVIPSVSEIMKNICWSCGGESDNMKSCKDCKVAKYCNRDCQLKDWSEMHKLTHKITKRGFDNLVNRI